MFSKLSHGAPSVDMPSTSALSGRVPGLLSHNEPGVTPPAGMIPDPIRPSEDVSGKSIILQKSLTVAEHIDGVTIAFEKLLVECRVMPALTCLRAAQLAWNHDHQFEAIGHLLSAIELYFPVDRTMLDKLFDLFEYCYGFLFDTVKVPSPDEQEPLKNQGPEPSVRFVAPDMATIQPVQQPVDGDLDLRSSPQSLFDELKTWFKGNLESCEWLIKATLGFLVTGALVLKQWCFSKAKVFSFAQSLAGVANDIKAKNIIEKEVGNLIEKIMPMIYSMFGKEYLSKDVQENMVLIKEIQDLREEANQFTLAMRVDFLGVHRQGLHGALCTKYENLLARFDKVVTTNKNLLNYRYVLEEVYSVLKSFKDSLMNLAASGAGKQKPVNVWIAGPAGVGKTEYIVTDIIKQLRALTGEMFPTYTRNPLDTYWSNYAGQRVIIWDDLGQKTKAEDIAEWMNHTTANPTTTIGAAIPDKGKANTSTVTFGTSNFAFPVTDQINDYEALYRRRDLLVLAYNDPVLEYKKKNKCSPPPEFWAQHPTQLYLFNPLAAKQPDGFNLPKANHVRGHSGCWGQTNIEEIARIVMHMERKNAENYRKLLLTLKDLCPIPPRADPIAYDDKYAEPSHFLAWKRGLRRERQAAAANAANTPTDTSSEDEVKNEGPSPILPFGQITRTAPLPIVIAGAPGLGKTYAVTTALSEVPTFHSAFKADEVPHGKVYWLDDATSSFERLEFTRKVVHDYHNGQVHCNGLVITVNDEMPIYTGQTRAMIERRSRVATLRVRHILPRAARIFLREKRDDQVAKENNFANVIVEVDTTQTATAPCDSVFALPGWILEHVNKSGQVIENDTINESRVPMPHDHKFHLKLPMTFEELTSERRSASDLVALVMRSVLYQRTAGKMQRARVGLSLINAASKLLPQFSKLAAGGNPQNFVKGFNAFKLKQNFELFDHIVVEFTNVAIGILSEDPASEARLYAYIIDDIDYDGYEFFDESVLHPDGFVEHVSPVHQKVYKRLKHQLEVPNACSPEQLAESLWEQTPLVQFSKALISAAMLGTRIAFIGTTSANMIRDALPSKEVAEPTEQPAVVLGKEDPERKKRTPAIEDGSSAAKNRAPRFHSQVHKERKRRTQDQKLDGSASSKHRQPRMITQLESKIVNREGPTSDDVCLLYTDEFTAVSLGNHVLHTTRPGFGTWYMSIGQRPENYDLLAKASTKLQVDIPTILGLSGAVFDGLQGPLDDDFDGYVAYYITCGISPYERPGRFDEILRKHLKSPTPDQLKALDYLKGREWLDEDEEYVPAIPEVPTKKEACIDPMLIQTSASVYDNTVVLKWNSAEAVRGLMLKEDVGITVAHFHDACQEEIERGEAIAVTAFCTRDHNEYAVEFLPRTRKDDLILFRLKGAPHYKDVTGHLMTEQQVIGVTSQQIKGIPCVFVSARLQQNRAVQVERNAKLDFEYTQTSSPVPDSARYVWQIGGTLTSGVSMDGDCGSTICILDKRISSKVVALHTQGSTQLSRGELLLREKIERMLEMPRNEMLRDSRPKIWEYVPEPSVNSTTGLTKVGESTKPIFTPKKTKKYLTGFSHPAHASMEPTVLSPYDPRLPERESFMDRTLALYGESKPLQDATVQKRINDTFRLIAEYVANLAELHGMKVRPLTKTEALNTPPYRELPGLRQIDRSGSAGFPFAQTGPSTKQDYLRFSPSRQKWYFKDNADGRRVSECIDSLLLDCKNGIVPDVVFTAYLKDEITAQKKIRGPKRKTRVFFSCPFDYLIAVRMHFGAIFGIITELHHKTPVKVGTTTDFKDIHWQCQTHLQTGDQGFASDMASFDAKLPIEFTKGVIQFHDVLYERLGQDSDDLKQIRHALHQCVEGGLVAVGSDVYRMHGSQLSGNPGTAVENSLIMWCLYYLVYQDLAQIHDPRQQTFDAFMENVTLSVYGDDNICTVSPRVSSWFHFVSFQEGAAKYNFEVTDAAKTGGEVPKLQPLRGMEFLKREFGRNGNTWFAALSLDSIGKALMWINGTSSYEFKGEWRISTDEQTIAASIEALFPELALHGRSVYYEWTKLIHEQAIKLGYNINIPSWTAAARVKGYALVENPLDWPFPKNAEPSETKRESHKAPPSGSHKAPRGRSHRAPGSRSLSGKATSRKFRHKL